MLLAGLTRDCHAARLIGVNVLLVAPLLGMQAPSVLLDQPDDFREPWWALFEFWHQIAP
jgi:hypothetical protein